MATIAWYEIPTSPQRQSISVSLNDIVYKLTFNFRNHPLAGWTLDIADSNGNWLVCGIAMVAGQNLLEQYNYLGVKGGLFVTTDGDTFASPTATNLGTTSHLWFGVRTA